MKYISIPILLFIFISCNENEASSVEQTIEIKESKEVIVEEEVRINQAPDIYVLPFFKLSFEDESFEQFYYELAEACMNYDTALVLNAIHDTLRFSKYECAYAQFIKKEDCDGCARCTKKGMLEGIFAGSNSEQVCDRLYEMVTKFGVGSYAHNKMYYNYLPIENAYVNFYFVDSLMMKNYFDYELLLPLKNGVEVREEISSSAKVIDKLSFVPINYSNEPGMGERNEGEDFYWLDVNGGYIKSSDVLTGFDYTLVVFEKTVQGWKITGFFQPPGC